MSDKQHLKDKEGVREALPQRRSPHDTGALILRKKQRQEAIKHTIDI